MTEIRREPVNISNFRRKDREDSITETSELAYRRDLRMLMPELSRRSRRKERTQARYDAAYDQGTINPNRFSSTRLVPL